MSTFKIYTRTGDQGQTSLVDGTRVSKAVLRIECYGTVDELNSFLGALSAGLKLDDADFSAELPFINQIQNDLFILGSRLACESEERRASLPVLLDQTIAAMEAEIDRLSLPLAPLREFILPGGSQSASFAHICRTVSRRAERLCVQLAETSDVEILLIQYLNRLSDYFFVLARAINHRLGVSDQKWKK